MTFVNILNDVYRRCNYDTAASLPLAVTSRIKAFVNETQQELASENGLQSLLRGSLSVITVANQANYALPPVVADIRAIYETTNDRKLTRQSLSWYRSRIPDVTAFTGTPQGYVMLGPQAVAQNPVASGVWVASSGADVMQANIDAVRTGGYFHQPAATTLNGGVRVQMGTQTDYIEITDFYLATAPVGDVQLFDAAVAGNVLATIPRGQTRSRYEWIALVPTPSSAITYLVDYERDVPDLVNDSDEPAWLPVRHQRLLATGALLKEYERTQNPATEAIRNHWTVGRAQLLAYVNSPSDRLMVPSTLGRLPGRSDLGPWFPAGTIWD